MDKKKKKFFFFSTESQGGRFFGKKRPRRKCIIEQQTHGRDRGKLRSSSDLECVCCYDAQTCPSASPQQTLIEIEKWVINPMVEILK